MASWNMVIDTSKKLDKELIELLKSQLDIKDIKLNILEEKKPVCVILILKWTPVLEAEGYAREISRKVQLQRKKCKLCKE